jgi:hypothetical protein
MRGSKRQVDSDYMLQRLALVLIELPCREKPALRYSTLCSSLTTGIAGHKHKLWRTLRYDTINAREQEVDLALSPVEFFRD